VTLGDVDRIYVGWGTSMSAMAMVLDPIYFINNTETAEIDPVFNSHDCFRQKLCS